MVVKYKRIASSGDGFTQNNDYIVLGFADSVALLLNDSQVAFGISYSDLNNTSIWDLVSIETCGTVQLYP